MPGAALSPQDAVGSLYSDHHGWLYAWLCRKVGCAHNAADLAQDVFVRLLATRTQLGLGSIQEPRAYLTTVARGMVIDFFRRSDLERAWLADLGNQPEAMHPSPEERLMALETLQAIDRLLDGLTPKTRAAWLHSRLDNMTHAEIAAQLGVSVPRVRQYLANAARHLYVLRFGEPQASTPPGKKIRASA